MAGVSGDWRLGHRPALDGLRGVAILLVVVSHTLMGTFPRFTPMGPVGVTAFFALSGFLITTLLLQEQADTGRISLREFYKRRARRLAPALFACVVFAVVLQLVTAMPNDFTNVVGALTWSTNWLRVDGVWPNAPLGHTWSLAVEEQFYLVWPLLLIAVVKMCRRGLIGLILVGIGASVFARFWILATHDYPIARIHYGTDTRADSLLIGCALAVFMLGRRESQPSRVWVAVGAGLLAWVCWLPTFGVLAIPFSGALGAAALIWGSAQGRGVRLLEARWLRYVGRRSYGLYLWHGVAGGIPVYFLGDSLEVLLFAALPVSWAATWLSWRYIESPWMRRSAEVLRPDVRGDVVAAVEEPVGRGGLRVEQAQGHHA